MKKKLFKLFVLCLTTLSITGCFKKDSMEDITIYTSVYPIEYLINELYGDKSNIISIYPDGIDYKEYVLNKKQLTDYSNSDLFIYNSALDKERSYALAIDNKLIDAASGVSYNYDPAELWLSPSNMLMMAQNIKEGFSEYISEHYLITDINKKYDAINLSLSEIDSELKSLSDNSNNKSIVVSDDMFKFLEKYGFTVISLEENENLNQKTISNAKKLIASGTIKYIYIKDEEDNNITIKSLLNSYPNVKTLSFNTLSTLSSVNRNNQKDYISIMNDNIDLLKKELYK